MEWLLDNSYDPQPEVELEHTILWDRAKLELQSPQTYDALKINNESWMEQLFSLGLVLLENIAPDELESFLSSIGPIRNSNYGKIMPLKTIEQTEVSLP